MINQEDLYAANKVATKFFVSSVTEAVKEGILQRVSEDIYRRLCIGYAPKEGGLFNAIENSSLDPYLFDYLGLTGYNDSGDKYEAYTNRIMLPIIEYRNVIGFSGRTLDKNVPNKYLNSKKSLIYNKSNVLYPIELVKKHINDSDFCILVEGYFDALTLISHGVLNVVSSCGTAFNDNHAKIIRRWSRKIYIMFDGDAAGKKTANEAKKVLQKFDIYGGIITLPEGYDPDDVIKGVGKEKFLKFVQKNIVERE
jgi:DNA primase